MAKLRDLTGQQFNYLTVLRRSEENTKDGKARWVCRCICGREVTYASVDITRKRHPVKSCGCLRNRLIGESSTTHGMSKHPAWEVWHSMKQRCNDPNHPAYHNYGGRGITVCDEWQHSFENFWQDMGSTYQRGLELDRRDNNKGYSPENCRWVPRKINVRNRRSNRFIETPLGRMTVAEYAERTGIGVTTLLYRISHGWAPELLCAPPDVRNVCTTSEIVVRGTDSVCTTQKKNSSAL